MNPAQQLRSELDQIHRTIYQLFMQQTRIRQRVYAVEAAAKCRDAGRAAALPIEFTSQFGEDCLIWDAFQGKLEGFFIECGAFDGYHYAVTYPLEAVGWKGLLVEGIPDRAAQCAQRRPNSRTVHAACTAPGAPPEISFTVVADQYGGMLSFVEGAHEQQRFHPGQPKPPMRQVRVPTATMNSLLESHPGGPPAAIDVAVIDVEFHEIEFLKGFDLVKWKPRLIMIEDDTANPRQDLTAYFATQPYEWVGAIQDSRLLVHKDDPDLARRVRKLVS